MKVYVAGGSSEIQVAREYIDLLEARGVDVTHDWTRTEAWERSNRSDIEKRAWAQADLLGVGLADLVWIVVPEKLSEGTFCELGYALALGKHIVASGPRTRAERRFYTTLVECFYTHDEAFAHIVAL